MKGTLWSFLLLFANINYWSNAQTTIDYYYEQVPIGGGGYITGMQVHPANSDIRYYRTDVGGAYRFNTATKTLDQLIFVDESKKDYYGVAGIALDPTDENKVILAVGRRCDTSQTAILVSNNKGEKWSQEIVPTVQGVDIYFAANGGRQCSPSNSDKDRQGNPIALNPKNYNELYIGARGTGLWKLDLTTEVFTPLGNGVIPNNVFPNSIRNIEFHPSQPEKVVIGYAGQGIFLGDTDTNTYEKISTNTDLEDISDVSISKDGDYMLVACRFKGIYKCSNFLSTARVWTKVYSYAGNNNGEAHLTVSCSPHDNNTAVTIYSNWNSLSDFYKTTDAGGTWTNSNGNLQTNIYPYKMDGHGSHVSQLAFDPFDNKKMYLTSWFTTMETSDWTAATIQWTNEFSKGHEEIVCTDLLAFPTNTAGNFLINGSGDHSGFLHDDITPFTFPTAAVKDLVDDDFQMVKGSGYTYCFTKPDNIYAITLLEWEAPDNKAQLSISNDGGATFTRKPNFPESEGKTQIAVAPFSADNIVIANKSGLYYSTNGGDSFTASTAVNTNNAACTDASTITVSGMGTIGPGLVNSSVFSTPKFIAADKELDCLFYFYNWNDGSFNVSTNGGQSFFKVSDGLPTFNDQFSHKTRVETVPGFAKHVWIHFNNDLFYSEDAGVNWTRVSNVQKARLMAIGKQIPGKPYPTIFLYGQAHNGANYTFYRSTDKGATWDVINNPIANEAWGSVNVLAGDMNIDGRYYLGTGGIGVIYGEPVVVLPVEKPLVEADVLNGNAILSIQLFNAAEVDLCSIEKSGDDMSFHEIGEILNPITAEQTFVDSYFETEAYYRVKASNNAGETEYSNIVFLNTNKTKIFTNWEGYKLRIQFPGSGNYQITVFDVMGRRQLYAESNGYSTHLNFATMTNGVYYVQIRNVTNKTVEVVSVVK